MISVVIPTRNRAETLKRMLDKLFEDNYPNLEVIVIDGGSTDATVDLIRSYGTRISYWVSEKDGGEYFAINKGLQRVSGDIVKIMSDDDVLRPGTFQKVETYFREHPDVDLLFGQVVVWEDSEEGPVRQFETTMVDESRLTLRDWLRERQTVMSLTSFFRRSVVERIGLMSTVFACGDVEYWARAASRGLKMGILPDILVDYHYTGTNGVIVKKWKIAADIVRINMELGSASDVIHSVWRKYVKPYTYRPVALTVRKIWQAIFGLDPAVYLHKRRGVKV